MLTLRLLPERVRARLPHPERCVEITHTRPLERDADRPVMIDVRTLRISPGDLVRLQVEADQVLGETRTEMVQAEAAWRALLAAGTPKAVPQPQPAPRT
ncbi:hypothetical protein [Streptomyces sp. NPDC008265]|uniref:hypothetical protein n=1 Tax=Streptomyces sp. NPDC008265 TaxID=3364824 RepID=UPI0036E40110